MTKLSIFLSLAVLLFALPATAATTRYVDVAGICGSNGPCYLHPQDAVNGATPGDTIKIYPGVYGHRQYTTPKPPHWGQGDQYAPALIVFRDNLTIEAVDPDPANTVIQTTYNFWVNKSLPGGGGGGSIEHSTGCTWDAGTKVWLGDCVRPKFGTAPNAVAIIASGVTLRGLTLKRPFDYPDGTYNTAGVMIGGLYAGYGGAGESLGFNNDTVENCTFSNVWHAVYIWHSSGNKILNNQVAALTTNHWAAISAYDGYNDAQINLGHLSENNLVLGNTLANKGIALGAWTPSTWTSNAGSRIWCNKATSIGVTYSHGPVVIGGNVTTGGAPLVPWTSLVDKVNNVTAIQYTGPIELAGVVPAPVTLTAQLGYTDSLGDGADVPVEFKVNNTPWSVTSAAGGTASKTLTLGPGTYTIVTRVGEGACAFTDTDILVIGPGYVLRNVLVELTALLGSVTDKQDADKIEKAIDHLTKALDPDLWLDPIHVNAKHGDKVFQEAKDAVNQLRDLLKDKKSTIPDATLLGFIKRIVAADRGLGEAVIADALAAHGNAKDIAKANEELAKGDREAADGKYDVAIEHYRNAWNHALHSMGKD